MTKDAEHQVFIAGSTRQRLSDQSDDLLDLGEAEVRGRSAKIKLWTLREDPPAQPHDRGITSRYQRAAAGWPGAAPPSHERFAAAMTSLPVEWPGIGIRAHLVNPWPKSLCRLRYVLVQREMESGRSLVASI